MCWSLSSGTGLPPLATACRALQAALRRTMVRAAAGCAALLVARAAGLGRLPWRDASPTASPRTTRSSTGGSAPSRRAWPRPLPAAPTTRDRSPAPSPAARSAATSRSRRNGASAPIAGRPWTSPSSASRRRWRKQNGPESTRYCGGCHDPISLFSGTKNIFTPGPHEPGGLQRGRLLPVLPLHPEDRRAGQRQLRGGPAAGATSSSCATAGRPAVLRDFLIRAYPRQHVQRPLQAPLQDARVLRRLPQAVHRPGGEQRRLGPAPEPVRQLEEQPLEPPGRRGQDHRVPRVPHAAHGVARPGGGRRPRLQPQRRPTASIAATGSSARTRPCPRC